MKVQEIKFQNIGLVEDGNYPVNGKNVICMGKNQSGKTTFLKAMIMLLEGTLKDFVRDENDDAVCRYRFDDDTQLEWSSREGQERLVLHYQGKKTSNPTKKLLYSIIGHTFDVNEFINLTPLQRKSKIAEFAGIDIDAYLQIIKQREQQRRDARRDMDSQKAKVKDYDPEAKAPEFIDTKKLIQQRDELKEKQTVYTTLVDEIKTHESEKQNREQKVSDTEKEILLLKERLKKEKSLLVQVTKDIESAQKDLETTSDNTEKINAIQDDLDKATEKNANHIWYQKKKEEYSLYKETEKTFQEAEKQVEQARNELKEAVEVGEFPEGVSISDDGENLLVKDKNGRDIEVQNLNDAAKVVLGLKIGARYMGKLNTMVVDLSMLDTENRKKVFEWAKSKDIQLFAEVVADMEGMKVQYKNA